jgi:molybdopterin converting factor small subunit
LSRSIKIFVNNIVIDALAGCDTEVRPGDEVRIIAASSGG